MTLVLPSPTSALGQATQAVLGGQWDDGSFGGKKVLLAEDTEKTALGVSEYAVYVSSLFNDEAAAAAAFGNITARYSCAASVAKAAVTLPASAPRVLWGSPFPASGPDRVWYTASCPNWYCVIVADAGGRLLQGPSSALTDAQFLELAKQADVFIYTGVDFEVSQRAYLPGATSPASDDAALRAIWATMPALNSSRVYDLLGQAGGNAWFQLRPVNSDALLQELVRYLQPVAAASAGFVQPPSATFSFLRNVLRVPSLAAVPPMAPASACPAGVAGATASGVLLSIPCPVGASLKPTPSANSLTASTSPLPTVPITVTFGGLPTSAVVGGALTSFALTAVSFALATATASTCATCTVRITSITDVDTGAVVFAGAARELQGLRLRVMAVVTAPTASSAASLATAAAAPAFAAATSTSLANSGFSGVSVGVSVMPSSVAATSAEAPPSLGGPIGGAIGGIFVLAVAGVLCMWMRRAKPEKAAAGSALPVGAGSAPGGAPGIASGGAAAAGLQVRTFAQPGQQPSV